MKCSIVKELLPGYPDGLTSEETCEDIRKHLAECSECRAYKVDISQNTSKSVREEDALEMLQKLKKKIRRNRMIASGSACILLLGLIIFARTYRFPLPFDANRMVVDTFQGVFVNIEDPFLKDVSTCLYDLDSLDLETTREVLNGEHEIVESVKISTRGINDVMYSQRNRVIERNGQEINVLYFCYSKTLWGSIFHGDFSPYRESLTAFGITGSVEDREEPDAYEPKMTEVYYLPIQNLREKLDSLSDEEFDAMRGQGRLIWSGMSV